MTALEIALTCIVCVLGLAFLLFILYWIRVKKPIMKLANETRINQCKKLDTIIEMLKVSVDPKKNKTQIASELHELASDAFNKTTDRTIEQVDKQNEEETKNKDLLLSLLEAVKSLKKGA